MLEIEVQSQRYSKLLLADTAGGRHIARFNSFFEFTVDSEADGKRVLAVSSTNGKLSMFGGHVLVRRPRRLSIHIHGSSRGVLKRPAFWFFGQRWQLVLDKRKILLPSVILRRARGADLEVVQGFTDIHPKVRIHAAAESVDYFAAIASLVIICAVLGSG